MLSNSKNYQNALKNLHLKNPDSHRGILIFLKEY